MKGLFTFAWRNLWRNRRRTIITLSSIVFAVIIAAFMRGVQLGSYDKMLNDAIRSTTGHLSLMDVDYWQNKTLINSMAYPDSVRQLLTSLPHVTMVAPSISTGALVSSGQNTRGVMINGVDPQIELARSGLDNRIVEGRYLSKEDSGILIGTQLGRYLKVGVGDSLVILGQGYMGVTAADELEVVGLFDHPMESINKRVTYITLSQAEEVFYMDGRVTSAAVVFDDYHYMPATCERLEGSLDTAAYEVRPWQEMNEVLLQQIESDNFFGVIIIGILYMVIGFGIFGTVLMMVMERRREFSVMLALGLRPGLLTSVVYIETIIMGCIGSVVGLALSFPIIYYFNQNPIPITGESAEIYYEFNIEPVVEVAIRPGSLVWQFVIVLLLSIAAAFVPVQSIRRFNFVSIIRGRA